MEELPNQFSNLIAQAWTTTTDNQVAKGQTSREELLKNTFTKIRENNGNVFRVIQAVDVSDSDKKQMYALATQTLLGDSGTKIVDRLQERGAKTNDIQAGLEIASELLPYIKSKDKDVAVERIIEFVSASSGALDKKSLVDLFQRSHTSNEKKAEMAKALPEFWAAASLHLNKLPSDVKKDALRFLLEKYSHAQNPSQWVKNFAESAKKDVNFTEHLMHAILLDHIEMGNTALVERYAQRLQIGEHRKIEQHLVLGPQDISPKTQIAQDIIRKLINNIDSVTFEFEINEDNTGFNCYISVEGKPLDEQGKPLPLDEKGKPLDEIDGKKLKKLELSKLLKETNFNHMSFSPEEIEKFTPFLNSANFTIEKPEHDNPYPQTGPEARLLEAERNAINIYTGPAYSNMIQLMQGKMDDILDLAPTLPKGKIAGTKKLKSLLITTAIAVQGLHKLPRYEPPPGPDGQKAPFFFRKEKDKNLQERIDAVKGGGTITTETGFISASRGKPAEGMAYKLRPIVTLFYSEGCTCFDVSKLSKHPTEDEVLLTPTQIQWKEYRELSPINFNLVETQGSYSYDGSFKLETKHLFIAKAVRVDTATPTLRANEPYPTQTEKG